MNMWNVHRIFITYIHRTKESRNTKNTWRLLSSGTKSFYAGFSIYPRITCDTCHKASASESQLSSSEPGTQLSLFKIPPNPPRALPVHDVIHIPKEFLFWHLGMTHPPRARAWTPALMLPLTNPCVKRKVLSLTKPKGKIYKTKSLGHYFTQSHY